MAFIPAATKRDSASVLLLLLLQSCSFLVRFILLTDESVLISKASPEGSQVNISSLRDSSGNNSREEALSSRGAAGWTFSELRFSCQSNRSDCLVSGAESRATATCSIQTEDAPLLWCSLVPSDRLVFKGRLTRLTGPVCCFQDVLWMLLSEMAPSRGGIIGELSFWSGKLLLGLFLYWSAAFILKSVYENTEHDVSPLSFLWNNALFKINALLCLRDKRLCDCILL